MSTFSARAGEFQPAAQAADYSLTETETETTYDNDNDNYYDENGEYYEGDQDDQHQYDSTGYPAAESDFCLWSAHNSSNVSASYSLAVSTVSFDFHRELLWSGTFDGRLISSHNSSLLTRTAFRAHNSTAPILAIHSLSNGILSVSSQSVRFHSRGGAFRAEIKTPKLIDFTCSSMADPSEPFLFLASRGSGLADDSRSFESRFGCDNQKAAVGSLDIVNSVVRREINVDCPYSSLSRSRYLIGSRFDGNLEFRDPRSLRLENSVLAHAGSISSLACSGDVIATCGYSSHPTVLHPQPRLESFIKLFDIRTFRPLPPIMFAASVGPAFLKFHPNSHNSLLVSSFSGCFQFINVDSGISDINIYQVDQPYESAPLLTGIDISSSGECAAFADNLGFIHQWTAVNSLADNEPPIVNSHSTELDSVEPQLSPTFDDGQLSVWPFGEEYCQTNLPFPAESDWLQPLCSFIDPGSILLTPDFIQPPIDISLIKDIKWNDIIGVVSLGKKKRGHRKANQYNANNESSSSHHSSSHSLPNDTVLSESSEDDEESLVPNCLATIKQYSGQGRNTEKIFKKRNFIRSLADLLHSPARNDLLISKEYARVSIKIPKFGLYAFDFSQFNQTNFTGLDNLLPNSYVNCYLQLIYFLNFPLRNYFLSHICEKENCLTCELGFLFHMFQQSRGRTAEPRNFLRALRAIPEAGGLNLLDDTLAELKNSNSSSSNNNNSIHHNSSSSSAPQMQLGIRIQDFIRFLLEQLNKEEMNEKKKLNELYENELNQSRIYFDIEKSKSHRQLNYSLQQLQLQLNQLNNRINQIQQSILINSNNPLFNRIQSIQTIQSCMIQQQNLIKSIQSNQLELQKLSTIQFNNGNNGINKNNHHHSNTHMSNSNPQLNDKQHQLQSPPMIEQTFGFSTIQTTKCQIGHQTIKEIISLSMKFTYSPAIHRGSTFAELLRSSINEIHQRRLYCEHCNSYQTIDQSRWISSFPLVLTISANVQTDAELEIWRFNRKKKIRLAKNLKTNLMEQFENAGNEGNYQQYAKHNQQQNRITAAAEAEDYNDSIDDTDSADSDYNWLPQFIRIDTDTRSGRTSVKRRFEVEAREDARKIVEEKQLRAMQAMSIGGSSEQPVPTVLSAVYELTGVVSHISDPPDQDSPLNITNGEHLVSHVKVPIDDLTDSESAQDYPDRWFVFNDFVIRKSSAVEATKFTHQWKQPSALFFSLMSTAETQSVAAQHHPLASAPLLYQPSLSLRSSPDSRSFTPLQLNEPMQLAAIDCEFVSVQSEVTEFDPEVVENVVVRPARLTLARVSVVRGEGQLVGIPFIDDYIATSESVVDYLTPFSGLVAGDLDRSISPHHLTTLKQAYIRLRTLVDRGVTFIGHGLKKDFQMINIVVPANQIQDTVEIYSLPNQRKLGLRFLARYVLNVNIQEDSHDSIEDSRTALALVKKYEAIMKQSNGNQQFQLLLQQLYQIGHKSGFKV